MEIPGTVVETMPNNMYRVELNNGNIVVAHIGPKMRLKFTRILPGDEVNIEVSANDHSRGRITSRKR